MATGKFPLTKVVACSFYTACLNCNRILYIFISHLSWSKNYWQLWRIRTTTFLINVHNNNNNNNNNMYLSGRIWQELHMCPTCKWLKMIWLFQKLFREYIFTHQCSDHCFFDSFNVITFLCLRSWNQLLASLYQSTFLPVRVATLYIEDITRQRKYMNFITQNNKFISTNHHVVFFLSYRQKTQLNSKLKNCAKAGNDCH